MSFDISDRWVLRFVILTIVLLAIGGMFATQGRFVFTSGSEERIISRADDPKLFWTVDVSFLCAAAIFATLALWRAKKKKDNTAAVAVPVKLPKLILLWLGLIGIVLIVLLII